MLQTVLLLLLQSCFVAKQYERPQDVLPTADLFRKEYQQADSANIGLVKRGDFFTDPLLRAHIETALRENVDANIAQQNIIASRSYFLQSGKAFLPTAGIDASAGYARKPQDAPNGGENAASYSIGAAISWEADIWGRLSHAKKAAFADMQRTLAARQAVQTTLIAQVATLYYQLLVLDEQKKTAEHTIRTRTKSLETSRALKTAGTLTEAAVKQGEALLHNARALLAQIDGRIETTENAFCLLLAREPTTVERGTLDGQQIATELAIGVPYQLLANRPDVRAAEHELMRAFEMANVARADFYPSLRLTAGAGLQSADIDRFFGARAIFGQVVASLAQPLWNGRKLRTRHEISLANQQIAYQNYRKAILNAGKEVSDALALIKASGRIEKFKTMEYEAYRTAAQYAEQLVAHGMANYLEVLRAQENALATQIDMLEIRLQKLNAIVQLYRALGGGS